jgi:hypothetical protein
MGVWLEKDNMTNKPKRIDIGFGMLDVFKNNIYVLNKLFSDFTSLLEAEYQIYKHLEGKSLEVVETKIIIVGGKVKSKKWLFYDEEEAEALFPNKKKEYVSAPCRYLLKVKMTNKD